MLQFIQKSNQRSKVLKAGGEEQSTRHYRLNGLDNEQYSVLVGLSMSTRGRALERIVKIKKNFKQKAIFKMSS